MEMKKTKKQTRMMPITGCRECKYLKHKYAMKYQCTKTRRVQFYNPGFPEWCPLTKVEE